MIRSLGRTTLALAGASALAAIWFALSLQRLTGPHAGGQHGAMAWSAGLFALPGLLAMFPCLMQMSVVLVAVVAGMEAGQTRRQMAVRGGQFLVGYVGVYALTGAVIGLLGQAAAEWLPELRVLGGVLLALLGMHTAGILSKRLASHCRGSMGLFLRLPPDGRPAAAGVAFAVYCSGCCAPYLYGAALLSGALGSVWQSTGVAVLFALGTVIPLVLPALSAGVARRTSQGIGPWASGLSRMSGYILVLLGALIAVEGTILPAMVRK